jgi:uncharacterized membrane protein YvbJ
MKRDGERVDFCQNCGFKMASEMAVCTRCGSEVKN